MDFDYARRRGAIGIATLAILIAAGCGDSPSGSQSVASIEITPTDPGVLVGATVQLAATVKSANGSTLSGVTVGWESLTPGVASVNASGRVAGIAVGTARVVATAGGRSDTVTVTVSVPSAVAVTAVAPATLQPGSTATITGAGFSPVPGENTVTVAGQPVQVTAATTTSLSVNVPASVCAISGSVAVRVVVAGMSGEVAHPWQGGTPLQVAVGQQLRLEPAGTYCLPFSGAGAQYLLGVQSVTNVATSLTPALVRGVTGAGPTAAAFTMPEPAAGSALPLSRAEERRVRHRAGELELRQQEQRFLASRPPSSFGWMRTAAARAAVSASLAVGDSVDLKYPLRADLCTQFRPIRGVVRRVGAQAVWIEDVANPAGGYSAQDYATLSGKFDAEIWATNVAYFGQPTDFDGNGRIIILITREVNRDDILGRVVAADFFPSECAASNGGEIFYGVAPDPGGTEGESYSVQDALLDAPTIIAHELAHVIQYGRRLTTPGATAWQLLWEAEGQATLAEEVVGHSLTGRQPRQNYGFSVGWAPNGSPEAMWYRPLFVDLALYFGANPLTDPVSTISGAPERCGWLDRPEGGNMGPCVGNRNLYGVSWSFLRWISDHYGPGHAGGEQGLHRAMIASTDTGFATMSRLTGQPIDVLLAQWAAALYVDDRVAGADSRLTLASWNMHDIFGQLIEPARLRPRVRAFENFSDEVAVRAGSTAYFRLGGGASAAAVAVTGTGGAPLPAHVRVWLVRLN